MSNTLAPFGFRHMGTKEGYEPTFGMTRRKIALGYTNPIAHGDPVVSVVAGYIQQAASNAIQIAGIFQGCEYYSVSQQRKVRSNYWPGSDALYDVDAFIIDTPNALFYAQCNGTPMLFSNIGMNVGFFIATGLTATNGDGKVNATTQLSGAMLDTAGTNGTTTGAPAQPAAGFPFRVVDLYSNYISLVNQSGSFLGLPNSFGAPVINGVDNSSNFNWAVVTFNNVDTKSLTGI